MYIHHPSRQGRWTVGVEIIRRRNRISATMCMLRFSRVAAPVCCKSPPLPTRARIIVHNNKLFSHMRGNERTFAVASGHCPQWFITISATGLIQLAHCCLSSVLVKVILENYPPSTATFRATSGRLPDDIIRYYFHLSLLSLHVARESIT